MTSAFNYIQVYPNYHRHSKSTSCLHIYLRNLGHARNLKLSSQCARGKSSIARKPEDHLAMSHGSPFWVLVQMLKQRMLQI